jgi:hypothetical protein
MQHTPHTMQQSRRCATVRNATHVVVLKHGEVVEAGTSLVPSPARPVTNPNPTLALPRVNEGH